MSNYDAKGYLLALDAVTSNQVSDAFPLNMADRVGLIAEFNANCSAGTVTLEVAGSIDYAGTWQTVLTCSYSAANAVQTDAATMVAMFGRVRLASLAGASAAVTAKVTRGRAWP